MTITIPRWWSERKCGCLSLGFSLGEILIIVSAGVLVHTPGEHNMRILSKVSSIAALIGLLGSFGFAIAGLVMDSRRFTAFVAMIVSVVTFIICGLLLLM